MKRAFSYLRWSQKDQGKGDSQRRQKEASASYAKKRGWTLDETLSLADMGVSAFKSKNVSVGALGAFLEACDTGRVQSGDVLIVESLDRISRDNIMEAETIFARIMKAGITVCTLSPEKEYSWELINANPFLKFELILCFIRANEESQTKSKRVAESWKGRRIKAKDKGVPITGVCPSWLTLKDGRFDLIPQRATVVRRMFALSLEGHAPFSIAKMFNKEGIATWNGKPWHTDFIWRIIRNRATLGEYQPKKRGKGNERPNACDMIPTYFPAVIDAETFHRVQGVLVGRKIVDRPGHGGRKGKDIANLFTGVVKDARDRRSMQIHTNTGKKYLVSIDSLSGGTEYVGLKYEYFEQAFLHMIPEVKLEAPVSANTLDAQLEAQRGELKVTKEKIQALNARMMGNDGKGFDLLLDLGERLGAYEKSLGESIERLEAESHHSPVDDMQGLQDLLGRYEAEVVAGRREEIRGLIKGKIATVVSSIWALPSSVSKYEKECLVQVFFKAGGRREYRILQKRGGCEVTGYEKAFTEGQPFPCCDLRLYKDA